MNSLFQPFFFLLIMFYLILRYGTFEGLTCFKKRTTTIHFKYKICSCSTLHLFLSLHLLLPGRVDGVHHPLDGEVGDGSEYGESEEEADDLVPAQRTGDVLSGDLPQHHRQAQSSLLHKDVKVSLCDEGVNKKTLHVQVLFENKNAAKEWKIINRICHFKKLKVNLSRQIQSQVSLHQ